MRIWKLLEGAGQFAIAGVGRVLTAGFAACQPSETNLRFAAEGCKTPRDVVKQAR
jgi:hypothetical protein